MILKPGLKLRQQIAPMGPVGFPNWVICLVCSNQGRRTMGTFRHLMIVVLFVLGLVSVNGLAVAQSASAASLAQTPPMGWNSWNKFACNVSEQLIRETADA